ncbi:NAD(P)H-hydrate epimerase [Histomonas meleagridis]|uniref:NAD(P)H-hydrate epimerase n=1 Tax=Histomonas meleagridis TaxID=135588 RepID=UPI00355A8151|nr:NAD(P)H-hydrate epimerase [Histomonas meleagridis]KAH0797502.1 NAD(P)H-hydrate epimerase [Histomonas meleagridis]
MVKAEQRAIKQLLIPSKVLMLNAGKSVAEFILDNYSKSKKIGIAVGYGNNGGDGFVSALYLNKYEKDVKIVSLGNKLTFSPDANLYLSKCQEENINITFPSGKEIQQNTYFKDCDLIVDALLGTGFQGEMRKPIASLIKSIPHDVPIVSVDIPSGLNGTTGKADKNCIVANQTITFARPKIGMKNNEKYTGKLIVTEIGIPPICFDDNEWNKLTNN